MFAEHYSPQEMMAAVCAKEIHNDDVAFVGIGIPMMAGLIAAKTHAPNATLVYEAGGVGAKSRRLPLTISDNPTTENAIFATEMWRIFSDTQAGFIDKGIIGGAQVDRYGNINTNVILGNGTYDKPKVRLPGTGGANDIASSCGETIIMMKLVKGKFVNKVDFISAPGHLHGYDSRQKAGLKGGGPSKMVTDKGIFLFDPESKEMYLSAVFPGEDPLEIKTYFEWDLKIADHLECLEPPTQEVIDIIHYYDQDGMILGGKKTMDTEFEAYYQKMKANYTAIELNL
ncbi:CoA-transferase subunit beta [Lawsonibacter sp. LCP25S3_G6]|uniref:CoA-transferase subunit beta n=1 Tax=unclassified Lawsonibacter TaxID=2617946 RepID=UPI003F9E39E6